MKRLLVVLLLTLSVVVLPGCDNNKEKGMNRPDQRKDLPRAAPPDSEK
jgi:hypothetical protein